MRKTWFCVIQQVRKKSCGSHLLGGLTYTRDDPNGEVSGSLRGNQEYLLMVKVPINVKQLSMLNPVEMKVVTEFVYAW